MKSIYLIMLGLIVSIGSSFAGDCTADDNAAVADKGKLENNKGNDGDDDGNGNGNGDDDGNGDDQG